MALSIQSLTVITIEVKFPIGFDKRFVTLVGVSRDAAYIGLTLEKSTCFKTVVIIFVFNFSPFVFNTLNIGIIAC